MDKSHKGFHILNPSWRKLTITKDWVSKVKVSVKTYGATELGKQTITLYYELENDDKVASSSLNTGGGAPIQMAARSSSFHFPVELNLPHPDLVAIASLKIISPFIGSRLILDRPTSRKAAAAIYRNYPWITSVSASDSVAPRPVPIEKPAISFSGGADSVAVSLIMPDSTPLIMAARTYHPEIGVFEPWTKADGPVGTMQAMPNDYRKFLVYTDFPYLSNNGRYCVYPDHYSFTAPTILLADHLELSHIVTGDIIGGLTGGETIFNPILMPEKARKIFHCAGLDLERPCNGVSEFVTTKIVEEEGLTSSASTCEYGTFGNPCMRCIKCLRKNLYLWAITGNPIPDAHIERFNSSDRIKNFASNTERAGLMLMPSFKFAFRRIGKRFEGAIGEIQHRSYLCDVPVGWVSKYYAPTYLNRPDFVMEAFQRIKQYAAPMSEQDLLDFARLDWRKNYAA